MDRETKSLNCLERCAKEIKISVHDCILQLEQFIEFKCTLSLSFALEDSRKTHEQSTHRFDKVNFSSLKIVWFLLVCKILINLWTLLDSLRQPADDQDDDGMTQLSKNSFTVSFVHNICLAKSRRKSKDDLDM